MLSKKDADKYSGQHVCIASFSSQKVVAANINPSLAYAEAKKRGCKNPVIFYVPRKDENSIFHQSVK